MNNLLLLTFCPLLEWLAYFLLLKYNFTPWGTFSSLFLLMKLSKYFLCHNLTGHNIMLRNCKNCGQWIVMKMVGIFAHYLGSCLVSDDGDRDKNNADCDLLNYDGDDDSVGWVCMCWQDLMLADGCHLLRLPPIQQKYCDYSDDDDDDGGFWWHFRAPLHWSIIKTLPKAHQARELSTFVKPTAFMKCGPGITSTTCKRT